MQENASEHIPIKLPTRRLAEWLEETLQGKNYPIKTRVKIFVALKFTKTELPQNYYYFRLRLPVIFLEKLRTSIFLV